MSHHIFHRPLILSKDALTQILNTYEPDILLDFNQPEGSGATIPDISGNGRDFTADGTESETPTLTSFYWRGPVGHLANAPGRLELNTGATWTIDTTWTANHTFVWGSKVNQGGSAAYQFDVESDRMVWTGQNTPTFGMIGAVAVNTSYNAASDNEFVNAFVMDGDGGQGTMYINGLAITRATVTPLDINAGNTWTIGQRFNGSNAAVGDYDGFYMYKNGALTDDEIYDIYVRASGQRHHFKEVVEGTSLATGLQQAIPIWELDGADAMDVSGQENHGSYIGGPTLGQPALEDSDQWLSSARLPATGMMDVSTGLNPSTDDFTISFAANWTNYISRVLWAIADDSNEYFRLQIITDRARVLTKNGVNTDNAVVGTTVDDFNTNDDFRVTLSWDATARRVKVYVNGILDVNDVLDASSIPTTAGLTERLNSNLTGGSTDGLFQGWYKWNRVLSDAEVARL